ncbi:MAG TPA: hypothetical protein VJB14_11720 [Planctomycetota bacterium]|nr:hypothetical protein [Planctomycetota bacterium]
MSPRKIHTKNVPKEEYADRWRKALDRRAAMEREQAAGASDPALLLAVQGVIAAADALTIFHRGERAAAERHEDALEVLARLTPLRGIPEASTHLAKLLRAKGEIEYTGRHQKPHEVAALLEHARRFFEFAEKQLPPGR